MPLPTFAAWMLEQEARAMRTRLAGVRPFALQESMLPAANLLPSSQIAIEKFLSIGRTELRHLLDEFLRWLRSAETAHSGAEEAQRRFTLLRLRFNSVLTQFDLFDNVITQRSENQTGVWLSGGDQSKLVAAYQGTAVEKELQRLLARGGVIGGTSAGAAVMSQVMILGGRTPVAVGTGFGFLKGVVVDQHFLTRHRLDRLLGVLARYPQYPGLGMEFTLNDRIATYFPAPKP